MSLSEGLLKLRWNNHEATFCHILHKLRSKPQYSDATLACEGRLFMVHRLVLATCSDFFDEIFQQTPGDTTRAVIVLNDARAQDVECLLDYMYCGQVNVRQINLASLLKTAECLKIKGLAVPEANVGTSNVKRNQDQPPAPENYPPKKKKRKKIPSSPSSLGSSPPSAANLSNLHSVSSATPFSSWNTTPEAPSFSSTQSTPSSSLPSAVTSSLTGLPLLHTSVASNQPLALTTSKANTTPVTDAEKAASQKSGWLQIVSSMRHGTGSSQESSLINPQQAHLHKQSSKSDVKSSPKTSSYETYPSQFLQTEIKEEIKEEPIPISMGPDDPIGEEEGKWENSSCQEGEEPAGYKRALYPPPALHPVVSGSGLTHSTPILPLGLYRVGSYTVQSGGQAWETPSQLQQSPEPGNPDSLPGASPHALDLLKKTLTQKGSSPTQISIQTQATMSPKMMTYAMCSNCSTNNTKLWRRNDKGEIVCNACGLYFKLHGVDRPSHLFRSAPMTRRRNPKRKKDAETCPPESLENVITDCSSQDREHVPETDPQDGFAVLNAALTLNSLLAKAKAQQSEALAAQRATPSNTNKVSLEATSESRPPPPPLLKIPVTVSEHETIPAPQPQGVEEGEAEAISNHSLHASPQPTPPPPPLALSQQQQHAPDKGEGRMFLAQLLEK